MIKNTISSFVLHSRPFRETSLLLNLLSREYGRISLVAKGVKRKKAQSLRAILQPFNLLSIEFVGKSELKTLSHVELVDCQVRHAVSNRILACGYYLNELVLRATQEWQESETLFTHYASTLNQLWSLNEDNSLALATVLRNFEVALLTQLGLAPDWSKDIYDQAIVADKQYHFVEEQGFEPVGKGVSDIPSLKGRCSGEVILSLSSGKYRPELLVNCKKMTQKLLLPVIGDRPIASRKMWL